MVGLWGREIASFFSHGIYQGHTIMTFGINPWGGVIVIFLIGVIFMTQYSSKNSTKELLLCKKCDEECVDPDLEFCQFCGEPFVED